MEMEPNVRQMAESSPRRRLKVFAVLDMKMGRFMSPFTTVNAGVACRMFSDSFGPDSVVTKHPEDFALYELGEFDEETGYLQAHVAPTNLGLAVQFMEAGNAKLS